MIIANQNQQIAAGDTVELLIPVYTFCGSLWADGLHVEVVEIRDAGSMIRGLRGGCQTRPGQPILNYLEETAVVQSVVSKSFAQVPVSLLRRVA